MKEIGKSALTTGLEVLQDVAKGENIKTVAKKRLKENSLAFLDDTVSRMTSKKSIKGSTNKQIAISSSKPKKRKHQPEELDDTIFSKLKKERKKLKMAKPVHKDSSDCSSSSLDVFLLPPTQSSFQKGKSIDYRPITSLTDGGQIDLKASGSGKEFFDLACSYLYLKVKVSKADDSNLDAASKVGFANYPIASLFNQVDVILGGKLTSSVTNTYVHHSILEVLPNYNKDTAESQ